MSKKIKNYGLNDDNYKFFLSDFDYYKLFPINGQFGFWIDDKLTTEYILHPYKEFLPEYYCHLKQSQIIPLIDGSMIHSYKDILELLVHKKALALKLLEGARGVGFHKLSFINGVYYLDSNIIEEDKLISFISKLENYLVTEYITPHPDLGKIYNQTANTVRVMVINEPGGYPIITNSYVKFGTKNSGEVDNSSAGGIIAIVDVESGHFTNGRIKINDILVNCETHPDTNQRLDGKLPHWEFIKKKLIEISQYLAEISYMGYDIAITENGFKIIEINSHQGINTLQHFCPLLTNNKAEPFFRKLLAEKRG